MPYVCVLVTSACQHFMHSVQCSHCNGLLPCWRVSEAWQSCVCVCECVCVCDAHLAVAWLVCTATYDVCVCVCVCVRVCACMFTTCIYIMPVCVVCVLEMYIPHGYHFLLCFSVCV